MKPEEKALLLTTARILRVHLIKTREDQASLLRLTAKEDIQCLDEDLAPFDGVPGEPVNETKADGQGSFSDEKVAG